MANVNDSVPEEPRRWAPSRIASAAVLVLLVLGGIAYGVYSLTSTGSSPSTTNHPKSSQLAAPNPKAKPSPRTSSGPVATNGSNSGGSKSNSGATSSSGTASPSNGNLSNTGPGDTAAIGFIVASIFGALAHYGWRRYRASV